MKYRSFYFTTVFCAFLWLPSVLAQPNIQSGLVQQQQARDAYLSDLGLFETSLGVQAAIVELMNKKAGFLPAQRRSQVGKFFSFVLTLHGLDGADLKMLDAEGINVVHALTADNRPLVEQALMADFVLTGTVQESRVIVDDAGNTYKDILIRVDDVMLGESPSETITIRQRNGMEYGENPREAAKFEDGNSYLLLLSNGLFRYGLTRRAHEKNDPLYIDEAARAAYFSIYRQYNMKGEKVLWSGYNKRKTKKALNEIRWLDGLLKDEATAH